MPEKVMKSPDLGFLEKRGDPAFNLLYKFKKVIPILMES